MAQRLVKVVDDRYQHFLEALNADPPGLDTCSKYSLPAACKQALAFMLHKGTALPKWRRYQVEKLRRIAHRLRPLDAALKKLPAAQRSESVNNLESKAWEPDIASKVGKLCNRYLFSTLSVQTSPDVLWPSIGTTKLFDIDSFFE